MNSLRSHTFFVTATGLLALACIAGAQDRHDGGHDRSRGGHPSRSREHADLDVRVSDDRGGWSGRPSDGGGRYNPFGRSTSRESERERPSDFHGRVVVGTPVRSQSFYRYDGRGFAPAEHYGVAPVHSALSLQIASGRGFGGTEVAVGARIGGLRVGFVSYSGYRRRDFAYPFYAYDPYVPGEVFYASPWYAYSYLPPYLYGPRVIVVRDYPAWDWDGWTSVNVHSDRIDPDVRNVFDDLRDAFEEESGRIADRLLPEEGDVAIFNGGRYDYSLNPDDFQKMFLDGVEESRTIRYEILDARTRGDEIRIRARHTFTDSWDKEQTVIHTITLRRENGGDYVIREFGSE